VGNNSWLRAFCVYAVYLAAFDVYVVIALFFSNHAAQFHGTFEMADKLPNAQEVHLAQMIFTNTREEAREYAKRFQEKRQD